MTTFRVWAPLARRVELQLPDGRRPMRGGNDGWYEGEVEARPGTDYGFCLDGGDPLPDPRSPYQPAGIAGLSRTVDQSAYRWGDQGWTGLALNSAVLYELHTGTFTAEGTFEAAVFRLDHLVELGVSAIELMPVAEGPGTRGWGYDGVDLFAPHHALGGPDGLKTLVDACHRRGLGVVLDVVYNHLGPAGNHLSRFGPYFTDRHRTPWGPAVNFDGPDSDQVRRFVVDNAVMWLRDYHLDGLRLDAVHAIFDMSAVHILEELSSRVEELSAELGRKLWVIAESDLNDPRLVTATLDHGLGCDAQWSDDFHHALHTLLTGERSGYYADFGSLADLAKALRQAFVYDWRWSPHRRRRHGRRPHGLSGHRFLAYAQNHDQVGNRARGERLSALTGPQGLRAAAALVLTSPFTPLIFQGEEWGASSPFLYFTDHQDPSLARAVRRGRAEEFRAFGWRPEQLPDPQAEATFLASKLRWDELETEPHSSLLAWYRELIRLRRQVPELSDGRLEDVAVTFDEGRGWLQMVHGPLTLSVNLGPEAVVVPCPRGRLRLASEAGVEPSGEGLRLPPRSVGILLQ